MTPVVRTAWVTGALVASLLLVGAVPASADELEDYLQAAQDAHYAGRRVVVTVFDGRSTAGLLQVEHAGNLYMVGDGSRAEVVGDGRLTVMSGATTALMLAGSTAVGQGTRYRTGDPVPVRRLGREAEAVAIYEGDLLREQVVFDRATGAPLVTEVYDRDGKLFRFSSMISFDDVPRDLYEEMTHDDYYEYEVIMPTGGGSLPEAVHGYRLGDTYAGPGDIDHSFYSDGLFTFSVFRMTGRVSPAPFEETEEVELAGARYRVVTTPSQLWVHWMTPELTYVLVGDLPPDHLDEVLRGLPRPGTPNIIVRMWRSLFG